MTIDQALQTALIHHQAGRLADAERIYRQILAQQPANPDALHLLGVIAHQAGRNDLSAELIGRAVAINPAKAAYHCDLGNSYGALGRLDEAVAESRRAIALRPDLVTAYFNLGNALKEQGYIPEAIDAFRRGLALAPRAANVHSSLVLALHSNPGSDARAIFTEARRWNEAHARPLAASIKPWPNDPTPGRTLRIGYVSADFYSHVSAHFLIPLLGNHDTAQFTIACYADVPLPDDLTSRMRGLAQIWRTTQGISDEQVAEQIRQDQIDILVDLKVHTARNRLLVFARKPAPIQVTWLGYPGTTGLDTIDYRLTDRWLDPQGLDEAFYSEKSVRLPDSFWCYDPLRDQPAVNPLPRLDRGSISFGCLNMFTKVNEGVLRRWAEILHAVPNSRLVALCNPDSRREWALRIFQQHRIALSRLEFHARQPHDRYLALYHRFDLGLDTFPCTGHTTTLDSLWMGVPVITLAENTAVARGSASILSNIGLPDLVAGTEERYVQLAVQLANDPPRLASLRSTLRERMKQSPLMDGGRFVRNIESAYRSMWQHWCESRQRR